MRTQWPIILMLFVASTMSSRAATLNADQQAAVNYAESANQSIKQFVGSGQAINDNLTEPLVSDAQMTTFSGEKSDAKIGCAVEKTALEVTILPGAGGDAQQLVIKQDLNFDGTIDNTLTSPFHISGICTNGVISCDQGTWNNCSFYRWGAQGNGALQFDAVTINQLGGCYCVNNSCGTNLIQRNLHNVLSDISGGALATMTKATNRYTASRFEVSGLTASYYVNELGRCGELPQDQASYMSNPGQLSADAFSAAKSDDTYDLLTTSDAANERQNSLHSCAVNRRIEVTHDIQMLSSCVEGTWFKIARTARNFDTYGDDAWLEVQAFCEPDAPLKLRLRAWDGAGKSHCNTKMGADAEGFVHVTAATNDSIHNGFSMTYPNLRGTQCYDVPVFYDGSCTAADGECTFNFTFYDGTLLSNYDSYNDLYERAIYSTQSCAARLLPNSTLKCIDLPIGGSVIHEGQKSISITFERPHLTPTPDLSTCRLKNEWLDDSCTSLSSDIDCGLMEEAIDGVTTVTNYQPTGSNTMPSAMFISDGLCDISFTRDWWQKNRTYRCIKNKTLDLSAIESRVGYVNQNTDSTTGRYKDKVLENGTWQELDTSANEIVVPFPDQPVCTKACKTRKFFLASDVATFGVETDLRVNNETYDYFYHECDASDTCPLGPGEELVSACACLNEFSDAATVMNMMRHAAKDTICSSGIPKEATSSVALP